jgi:hypothetical protein
VQNENNKPSSFHVYGALSDLFSDTEYCDLKLEYRFAYAQGDGVAFYGELSNKNLLRLAQRLCPGELLEKLIREGTLSLELKRTKLGYHYSHYNTVRVDRFWDCDSPAASEEELAAVENFVDEIKSDIRSLSMLLERVGYAEIENSDDDAVHELLLSGVGPEGELYLENGKTIGSDFLALAKEAA